MIPQLIGESNECLRVHIRIIDTGEIRLNNRGNFGKKVYLAGLVKVNTRAETVCRSTDDDSSDHRDGTLGT
jgi:hypothetical protein